MGVIYRKRTAKEREDDFIYICNALQQRKTWIQIFYDINDKREYHVSVNSLKKDYHNRLKKTSINILADVEIRRIVEDLDLLMYRCLQAFENSIGEQSETTRTLKANSKAKDDVSAQQIVVKTMKKHGDTKYLNIYLKFLNKKIALLGLEKETIEINHSFKDFIVDVPDLAVTKPVQSEQDIKDDLLK